MYERCKPGINESTLRLDRVMSRTRDLSLSRRISALASWLIRWSVISEGISRGLTQKNRQHVTSTHRYAKDKSKDDAYPMLAHFCLLLPKLSATQQNHPDRSLKKSCRVEISKNLVCFAVVNNRCISKNLYRENEWSETCSDLFC